MCDISAKEIQALLQFRRNLVDLTLDEEKDSDAYLLRWLRARDLNIKKAEEMLRSSLKWREENRIDATLEWKAPEKYSIVYPMAPCGYDLGGHPIFIIPTRFTDPDFIWTCEKDEYFRYAIQNMERIILAMKKFSTKERPIWQCVLIYDLDQAYNMRALMCKKHFDFVQESSKIFNENYPEIVHKAYFLYSPKLFTVLFAMIKHVIPKKSVAKFQIFGMKKESWVSELLSHIPEDVLPERYGGTNSEFDKTTFLNCKLANGSFDDDEEMSNLIEAYVPAGKKLSLDYKIEERNSTLKWNFKSMNHDIGFSVHLDGEEIVNQGRVESHKQIQEGLIICQRKGEYTVVFENSYSRLRSKTIYYRVEIEGPT